MAVWVIKNNLNCRHCNKQIKEVRGCNGFAEPKEIEGIMVNQCPLKEVTTRSWLYIEAYNQYKNGFLPNNGGWLKQPMKFINAISLIDKFKEDINAE